MTLRVYGGEFLVSPVPLEWAGNWCTHACWYCFANLNKPQRRVDLSWLPSVLQAFETRRATNNLHRLLLDGRFPILASNLVDPFSQSNAHVFREVRAALGSRVRWTYQTKGGRDDELIADCINDPPTMWYVSITSDQDDVNRLHEPGAPPFSERIRLVKALIERGHLVVAGINPMVPDWYDDLFETMDLLRSLGVRHAWIQAIHLSRFQFSNIRPKQREQMAPWIKQAMAKKLDTKTGRVYESAIMHWRASGGLVYGGEYDVRFWRAYHDLGFGRWPTLVEWFAELEDRYPGKYVEFSCDDLCLWVKRHTHPFVPNSAVKEMIQPFARSIRNLVKEGERWRERHEKPKTWEDVIDAWWRWWDYPTRLEDRRLCMSMDGDTIRADEQMRPLFIYVPGGARQQEMQRSSSNVVEYQEESAWPARTTPSTP